MKKIFIDFEWHPIEKEYWRNPYIVENEIIQFGAIMLDENHNEIKRFNQLVRPDYIYNYSNRIINMTHINIDELEEALSFEEVLNDFIIWCEDDYKIYSWSDSDIRQIVSEIEFKYITITKEIDYMLNNWIDYQAEFDQILGFSRQLSLQSAIDLIGIEKQGEDHNALYDALNMSTLYTYSQNEKYTYKFEKIREAMEPTQNQQSIGDLFDKELLLSKLQLS